MNGPCVRGIKGKRVRRNLSQGVKRWGKKKNNYLATKKKIRFSLLELLFSLLVKSVFNYSSIIIIINLMGLNYKYYKYKKN